MQNRPRHEEEKICIHNPHLQKAKDTPKSSTSGTRLININLESSRYRQLPVDWNKNRATIESDEIPNNENISNTEEKELQLEKHIRVKSRN